MAMPGGFGGRNMKGREKPRDIKGTTKRLIGYLKPFKFKLIFVVVCILLSSVANIFGTAQLRPIIDDSIGAFSGTGTVFDLPGFVTRILMMLGGYIIGVVATYTYSRIMLTISTTVLKNIRDELFLKMQELPISYFDKHTHGELMSRYTSDIDSLRDMLSQSLPQMISSVLTIAGVFIVMLINSWILTLIVLVMLFVMLLFIKTIGGKSGIFFAKQQASVGVCNGYIEEHIEGQKVIKVFCHENEVKQEFAKHNEELRKNACKANTYANILMPIMGNLSHLLYALIAVFGSLFIVINFGGITPGIVVMFLPYTRTFTNPITQISMQVNSVMRAIAGGERVFGLMDVDREEDYGTVTLVNAKFEGLEIVETEDSTGRWAWKQIDASGEVVYTELRGDIRFNNVTFGYTEDKPVLKNISLYAKPGQKIAFVGSTGAGKTTITNLINRFYDINDGEILYDGINIKNIKKSDLRSSLGIVLQDTHLFTGNVMDNIRYGRLEATDDEVMASAKLANADFFISHLPSGYDTMVTADGENLSQGQRQLLAISRAAVASPPVLILDEATSSIDTRTEKLIELGMDGLMEGRTVFVIAHRLSTVRNANAIMVLENGEIIERGSHDELLAKKGKYYELYTGKFELS